MSAYYNEIDPFAAEWLRNLIKAGHIAPGDVDERSIADVKPDDLAGYAQCHFFAGIGGWSYALRLAGWDDERPVWTGSCPCPPFSSAGKKFRCPVCDTPSPVPNAVRTGAFNCIRCDHEWQADERHLWPEFFRLIRECRPGIVFGEQVASKDGRTWLDIVQASLEICRYTSWASDLPAAGVGAPHIRQRLLFVADSNSERRGEQRSGRILDGERAPQRHDTNGRGADGRLEYATSEQVGLSGRAWQSGSAAGGLGDALGAGLEGHAGHGDDRGQPGRIDTDAARPIAPTGWADCDWISCRDGKARPAKPGIFPLADGFSFKLGSGSPLEGKSRVGMLRAAGNAIVPQLAAEFIGAFMECRP